MRIGFNCIDIDPRYRGGVTSFALGLLNGLVQSDLDCEVNVFVTPRNANLFAAFEKWPRCKVWVLPVGGVKRSKLLLARMSSAFVPTTFHRWIADTLLGDCAAVIDSLSDIVYTPSVSLNPYSFEKPTVVSMHDIQHVHYPEFFSPIQRSSRQKRYSLTARLATRIQASSEFIMRDFIHTFSELSIKRVAVIPEGVMIREFSTIRTPEILSKYKLPGEFMFLPAQLWPHKNHITVLKALNYLKKERGIDLPLVLTGAKYSAADDVFRFIKDEEMTNVFYLGVVPFNELVALYQRARLFVTAVLYESSSLPFLEAAAAGCPIICSNTPPNVELARTLKANLFNPDDPIELAELIASVWPDEALRSAQIEHNRSKVLGFDWDKIAIRYWELFRELIYSR